MAAGGGDAITINGTGVTDANFNDTTPAASAGRALMEWQRSGSGPDSVSVQTPSSVPIILTRQQVDIVVANTTTETDIFNFTVPGNTLSTNRTMRLVILGVGENSSGSLATITLRIYFGGTAFWVDSHAYTSAATTPIGMYSQMFITNQDATNDQTGGGLITGVEREGTGPTVGQFGNLGTGQFGTGPYIANDGAIDTTANRDFRVSVQWDIANANATFTRLSACLVLI
ncbi:MAG: hypothetical protein MN733_09980 [Nitrososphaera sp.]|nr:hypothetical protein [Nitrososphaera sp.]